MSPQTEPHVLLVEDEEAHVELIRRALAARGFAVQLTVAPTLEEARAHLAQSTPDLILCDWKLPDGEGIQLLPPNPADAVVPLVLMTSHGNERLAVEAMKAGVLDYVVKSVATLADMPHTIERALREWEHIAERKRAEQALRESERFNRRIMEACPYIVYVYDAQRQEHVYVNRRLREILGHAPEAFIRTGGGFFEGLLHDEDAVAVRRRYLKLGALQDGGVSCVEYRLRDSHDAWRWMISYDLVLERDKAGNARLVLGFAQDITDRRHAEQERRKMDEQLRQTQKLESLGVLAGGIAHDFNNLLMSILGNAAHALEELAPSSRARKNLKEVETAAERAAGLTRQLLTYSGGGTLVMEPLDLSELVEEMIGLLKVTVSKKALFKLSLQSDLPAMMADATQIRQVVMNLITNAAEAVGDRPGTISVTAGAMHCDAGYLRSTYLKEDLPEGLYVYLEVSDTGCGMDAETVSRAFDPFFTTKFTGRGLGLAAALGIVRSHEGALDLRTAPGKGTTFRVLFPASARPVKRQVTATEGTPHWLGRGTVLVVDDEEAVRTLVKQTLEKAGFAVLLAVDGQQAVEVFRSHADEIVAVVLDMTMPHKGGAETFGEIQGIRADARVILSSGYTEQDALSRLPHQSPTAFIQKPYRPRDLLATLRCALEHR